MIQPRSRSVRIAALVMLAFGLAEIFTAVTHNFFGLRTAPGAVSSYVGASIGACYAASGLVILTVKRGAKSLAIVLLAPVILGRLLIVATGVYPVNTLRQVGAIILGTAIAAGFAIFIALQRSDFQ
jgi:hypothetical protein